MTWYKTEVKGLSLWNLVRSSGVPKNPGEKPRSKKRTRKVKPKVVTASSLLNIPTPTSSPKGKRRSSSTNEQENDVSLSPCVSPTIPYYATVPPTQMGWIGNPPSPYGYPPFPLPHGYPPSHSPYAYPSYSGYPSSSYPSHSRQPQFSPYSSYTGHQLHSFPTTQTVYKSPVPNHSFVLKFITSRISKCQGCKQQFRQAAKQSLNPPHDLIVSRLEQQPFVASDGSVKVSSTPSNSHYHLKMQCLLNADPNFTIDTLIIQEDVKEKFLPVRKSHLQCLGVLV